MKVTLLSNKKGINFISTMVTCCLSSTHYEENILHEGQCYLKKPEKLICKNKEENCAGDANKKQSKRSLVTCTCFPFQIKRFSNQLAPLIGAV